MLVGALNTSDVKSREYFLALVGQVNTTGVLYEAVVVYQHCVAVHDEYLVVAACESSYRGETQLFLEDNFEVGKDGSLFVVSVVAVVGADHGVVRGLRELAGVHVGKGRH